MAKGRLNRRGPCGFATNEIDCANGEFDFAKVILQELSLFILPNFILFWRNLLFWWVKTFFLFDKTSFCDIYLVKLLHLAKPHLVLIGYANPFPEFARFVHTAGQTDKNTLT